MNIKPRHKRRFFWSIIVLIGLTIIGLICVPPFINLNKMKPILQAKLYQETGIQTQINGNINFSLLGSTTIVAHDIQIPNGKIDNISFSIPFKQIFNLQNATLNQNISIYNANIKISNLLPYNVSHNINIYDSNINFMNHDYKIIRGKLFTNQFYGQIRTSQHKYELNYNDGEFTILNNDSKLHIRGTLFPDGGAAGELSITTDNINKWFEFESPQISELLNISMEFNWDGEYGFDFTNIHANNYTGSIKLLPNGFNYINFKSNNANLDISFIANDKNILTHTNINFDLSGKIKFQDKIFSKFKIIASGLNNKLEINHIIADNIELSDGTYDNQGLHNTKLQINHNQEKFNCNFSGTSENWECKNFVYNDINGNITNNNGIFNITANSTNKMPSLKTIQDLISDIGDNGTITFSFSNMAGTMIITPKQIIPKFHYAQDITLRDINLDLKFLPEFMSTSRGTYTSTNNKKTFIPQNKQWTLDITNNNFTITGTNFKQWIPNINLKFLNDLPYVISGTFSDDNIDNLNIMIAGHIFSGNMTKSGLNININTLNLDSFINPIFQENYDEQKFLMNHPIAIMFEIPQNISISADTLILDNIEYKNFVYSLKPNTQIFSISDSDRGHMLSIIEKNKFNYDISIQLNKFQLNRELLELDSPLNIANTNITGEIKLHTSGQTANDLIYNLNGDIDITFNGGIIYGLGFDNFYASADKLTVLNAEYALSSALESGKTQIKKLKIQGIYNNGNFETTKPLTLSMSHIEGVGALFINNHVMTGTFEFILRGTNPKPVSLEMSINEYGKCNYSITEIINNLDIGYMRAFTKMNNRY